MMRVPYLREETIEKDAETLLADFERCRAATVVPPVPVEEIVEQHLGLTLDFDDLHRLFELPRAEPGQAEILGAIDLEEGRVIIDQSLDPDQNPALEGRYFFTVTHEGGGHWRLHRHLFRRAALQQAALFDQPSCSTVICRSNSDKRREEWQADYYASCLLMPRKLVRDLWVETFPDGYPRILEQTPWIEHSFGVIPRTKSEGALAQVQRENAVLEEFVRPLARRFRVSPIAMRIRLENLGLLLREVPAQKRLFGT